jgi:hypothetical protein
MFLGNNVLGTVFLYFSHPTDLYSRSAPPIRAVVLPAHQSGQDATRTVNTTRPVSQMDVSTRVQSPPQIGSLQRRRIQERKKPHNRKPKYYWSDLGNLRTELDFFWKVRGVLVGKGSAKKYRTDRVVIPNETLLRYYRKNDLRGAVASHGGRYTVAEKLKRALPKGTTVEVMSGTWTQAVTESLELQALIQLDPTLSKDLPPKISSQSRSCIDLGGRRWLHKPARHQKGYWSDRTAVIQSL